MEQIEFQWLHDEPSFKDGLKTALGCSGQLIKKHYSSKEQDRRIQARQITKLPLSLVNHLKINPEYQGPKSFIIKETSDWLAVHKPSGVHCHPLTYEDKDTLLNFLVTENKWESLLVNTQNYDRGLLYRLDYETSGLMILAKNETLLKSVRDQFAAQMKRKFYWAIVKGNFDQEGVHTHYFKSSGAKGSKQKVTRDFQSGSDEGTLTVRKVLEHNGYSLVMVNLKTGLRHQIRAQLAELGFPLVGDELYGGIKAKRLFLHALRYEWSEVVEDFEADLFGSFFDLNRAHQMSHDMFGSF